MNRKLRKRRKKGLDSLPINTSISIVCAAVNFIIIVVLTIKATTSDGNAGILTGLVGLLSIAIGGYGIYYSIKALKEDDNNYITVPLIGIIANSVLTLFLVVLYIIGIFV